MPEFGVPPKCPGHPIAMHLFIAKRSLDNGKHDIWRHIVPATIPVLCVKNKTIIDQSQPKGALRELHFDGRRLQRQ
jgi:hypothetical protein